MKTLNERPFNVNAHEVVGILAGWQTQIRRAMKTQPFKGTPRIGEVSFDGFLPHEDVAQFSIEAAGGGAYKSEVFECPYGSPGDLLWAREAWRTVAEADQLPSSLMTAAYRVWFEADNPHQLGFGKLRPSIHMPRWASRILLEITSVRVERLHDTTEGDIIKLGCPNEILYGTGWFRNAWNEQFGSWDINPWVWAVDFRMVSTS